MNQPNPESNAVRLVINGETIVGESSEMNEALEFGEFSHDIFRLSALQFGLEWGQDEVTNFAPEVARHLSYKEKGRAEMLLALPARSWGETTAFFLPVHLQPEAVHQFGIDLLRDLPQALAVKAAFDATKSRQDEWIQVKKAQTEKTARDQGFDPATFCGFQPSRSPEEREEYQNQFGKVRAVVEKNEAFQNAFSALIDAKDQQGRALDIWARLYWPNSIEQLVLIAEGEAKPRTRAKKIKSLPHPTFIEARRVCEAVSDGRDGRHWAPIEGVIALLHCAPKATHSVRFEPSARLLNWWGTSGVQLETLREELARLDLDDVILFRVVLSAILHNEKARFSAPLDDFIKLIGRDGDARKSAAAREKWRAKVWRSIVLFDSLAVIGTRGGMWKEPGAKGSKRARMDAEQLYTRDPLLLISGTRDTEQGTFDGSAPPKTVSLVPGDWLMPFHGNREILSEFGDVLPIAQIPRGKPSGAWAACAGLMLSQLWRELATRATVERNSRGKESKVEVLKFRAFTRRELLAGTFRSDYDVNEILNDPKGRKERAQNYWKAAIKELKTRGVISHYAELPIRPGSDWRAEWLNQPLDIRPAGEMLTDALQIHKAAQEAKKRGTRKRALPKAQSAKDDG